MQYGHFDNKKREYVIDRIDLPVSWTNYLGVKDTCVVVNHTAGGYMFYQSPEYHRVTRFRGNAVPMDRPGHYVYIRDNEDGDYWSISWQPVGKPLNQASAEEVGANGICKGLRADWNDCLNLGGGESAMVTFLHFWAIRNFLELAEYLGRKEDVEKYTAMLEKVQKVCDDVIWDQEWFIRGITKNGRKIGTMQDEEGKVHLESNTWAVLSGAAGEEKGKRAMDSVDKYLYTQYGLLLNAPSYTKPDFISQEKRGKILIREMQQPLQHLQIPESVMHIRHLFQKS